MLLRVAAPVAILAALYSVKAISMENSNVRIQSFHVVGIQSRTTNAREMTSGGVIPKMWARASAEKLFARIPDRLGHDVIALYTNYQSDRNGEYDYVLGVKVPSAGPAPPGMISVEVPAGDYTVLKTGSAPPPDAVVGLWQQIWSLEEASRLQRSYRTDFEVHHRSRDNPDRDAKAELYVGVK